MLLSVALYLFGLLFRGKMKILVTTVVLRARALLSTTYLLFTYLQQTTIPNGWVGGGCDAVNFDIVHPHPRPLPH